MVETPSMIQLNTVEEAIEDIRAGKVIIVVDDEDRENEGDFICAAETITPEIINFMATYGRGLICTPIAESRADKLGLDMMVPNNTAMHETAFTVSIDLIGHGCTTGISAYDRSTCIKALVNPNSKATDFARPGHIFPLRSKEGGVLRRTGHTEAATDLALLAGFGPIGVLVEILNEDGTMARLPQLAEIAKRHNLKIISIEDLVKYRMKNESLIKKDYSTEINTEFGIFKAIAYRQQNTNTTHLALVYGDVTSEKEVLLRAQSFVGKNDGMNFLLGTHGKSLKLAMKKIQNEGCGIILFVSQPNVGDNYIDLLKRLDISKNTHSNSSEVKDAVQKNIGIGAQILHDIGVKKLRILTNTQRTIVGLEGFGLEVVGYVGLE